MIKFIIALLFFLLINLLAKEVGLFNAKEGIVIFMAELLFFGASAYLVLYPYKD